MTPPAPRRRACSSSATAGSRSSTGPATARPTPSSGTPTGEILICADHLIAPHLLEPAALPAARRLRRAPAGAGDLPRARSPAPASCPPRSSCPGHGDPITDHVALIDERFALHRRRAEKLRRPDRRAAAHRVRAGAGAVGQRRRHPGVPDAVRGGRPRRPADRRRARARGRRGRRRPLRGSTGDGRRGYDPSAVSAADLHHHHLPRARWRPRTAAASPRGRRRSGC